MFQFTVLLKLNSQSYFKINYKFFTKSLDLSSWLTKKDNDSKSLWTQELHIFGRKKTDVVTVVMQREVEPSFNIATRHVVRTYLSSDSLDGTDTPLASGLLCVQPNLAEFKDYSRLWEARCLQILFQGSVRPSRNRSYDFFKVETTKNVKRKILKIQNRWKNLSKEF
jgi:hypothetical protein